MNKWAARVPCLFHSHASVVARDDFPEPTSPTSTRIGLESLTAEWVVSGFEDVETGGSRGLVAASLPEGVLFAHAFTMAFRSLRVPCRHSSCGMPSSIMNTVKIRHETDEPG